MTTRTRALLDLLLAHILFALLVGIYLAASHAIESHVKAAGGAWIGRTAGERRRARLCRRPHARHVAIRRTGLCAISIR